MYFAVAPNMRNKGYEAAFFTGAMFVLKEIEHLIISVRQMYKMSG